MKIAFYVQRVASAPGFRNNISAHVQLPVKTMLLLRERGHDVELITTEFGADLELPEIIDDSFTIRQVPYGTKQGATCQPAAALVEAPGRHGCRGCRGVPL